VLSAYAVVVEAVAMHAERVGRRLGLDPACGGGAKTRWVRDVASGRMTKYRYFSESVLYVSIVFRKSFRK